MTVGNVTHYKRSLAVGMVVVMSAWSVRAQDSHSHGTTSEKSRQAGALVKAVREATERFKDVAVAGEIDVTRPEIVIYEPQPNGRLQLIGADYIVIADQWNATHSSPPELMGQLFHLFDSPNRFGLPAFYTLHVWAWKESPTGTFVNWHTNVSCDAFGG